MSTTTQAGGTSLGGKRSTSTWLTALVLIVIIAGATLLILHKPAKPGEVTEAQAKAVHHKALTIDAHIDIYPNFNTPGNDAGTETADQVDLPKLERGDLDVATIALFAETTRPTPQNYAEAWQKVDTKYTSLQRWVTAHPDRLAFAKSTRDIDSITNLGKHAILLSFLNAFWFNKDTTLIDTFYNKGVRVFGLAWAGNNNFTGSSRPLAKYGDQPNQGLTKLGESAIARLNQLGVVVDVSQLTTASLLKVVDISKAPVIASHSAVRTRVDVARNLTDAELKAIAAKGGVVHIVAFGPYVKNDTSFTRKYIQAYVDSFHINPLKDDPKEKLDSATYRKYEAFSLEQHRNEWKSGTLADFIDAVDYAVKLIGIDHVGLSSDFNHGGGVAGFSNEGEAQNITAALLKRGYSEEDIDKLWGGNFLRVFKAVEKAADK